jgi:O-antigen ligase
MLININETYFHVFEIPFLLFMVTAVIARISMHGAVIKTQFPSAAGAVLWALVFYMCAILLSAIGSIEPALVLRATIKWIEMFLIVCLTFYYITRAAHFRFVYWLLFVCAFTSIVYVVFQILTGEKTLLSFRIFPSYESAMAMALLLPFYQTRKKKIFWLALSVCVISAFLSFSRGAWIATIVTIIYTSRTFIKTSGKKLAVLFVFSAVVLLMIPAVRDLFSYWIGTILMPTSASNVERVALYRIAVQAFLYHPLFGVGSLNFPLFFMREGMVEGLTAENLNLLQPHNTFLQVAAEEGLVGLICFSALVGSVWFLLWKEKRKTGISDRYMAGLTGFFIVMFFNLIFGYIASQFRFFLAIMIGLVLGATKILQDGYEPAQKK